VSRRVVFVVVVILATLAAVVAGARLPAAARGWMAVLLVPLPAFMRWQARASEGVPDTVPRSALYVSSAALLWLLAGATALVAWGSGLSAARLGLVALPGARFAGWACLTYLAGVAVLVLGRALRISETPLLRHLIPITPGEKVVFAGLSLTAGFAEELIFRGFLLWALAAATRSMTFAVAASSVVFGIMHAYQEPAGAARAAVLGAVLAVPVAHAAIDLTSGLLLARWLLRG
jgi:membrane protease YdiL (CAAX protease family)